jgi:hypothetical protein
MRKPAPAGRERKLYSTASDGIKKRSNGLKKGAGIARAEGGNVMRTLTVCGCGRVVWTTCPCKHNLCVGCIHELALVPVMTNIAIREWVSER